MLGHILCQLVTNIFSPDAANTETDIFASVIVIAALKKLAVIPIQIIFLFISAFSYKHKLPPLLLLSAKFDHTAPSPQLPLSIVASLDFEFLSRTSFYKAAPSSFIPSPPCLVMFSVSFGLSSIFSYSTHGLSQQLEHPSCAPWGHKSILSFLGKDTCHFYPICQQGWFPTNLIGWVHCFALVRNQG